MVLGAWVTKGNVTEQAILNFFLEDQKGDAVPLNDHKKSLTNF
jgi:hypothetical protein